MAAHTRSRSRYIGKAEMFSTTKLRQHHVHELKKIDIHISINYKTSNNIPRALQRFWKQLRGKSKFWEM